jgi:hypothetical protein
VLRGQLRAGTARRANHERHAHLAAEHVLNLRGVVDDLVHRHQDEVDRHDLDHRPQAHHGGADAGADEPLFRDRGLAHAHGAVLLPQAGRDLVGALEPADLLAHQEHVGVALELLVERLAQRLAVGHVGHVCSSPRSP